MSAGLSTPVSDLQQVVTNSLQSVLISSMLKRRASPSFDTVDNNHKRMKQDKDDNNCNDALPPVGMENFTDVLVDDLQCGCCSELVYKPVLVIPCQHFFCGRRVSSKPVSSRSNYNSLCQLLHTLDSSKYFSLSGGIMHCIAPSSSSRNLCRTI